MSLIPLTLLATLARLPMPHNVPPPYLPQTAKKDDTPAITIAIVACSTALIVHRIRTANHACQDIFSIAQF